MVIRCHQVLLVRCYNLFYDNDTSGNAKLISVLYNLYAGSGTAQYLEFDCFSGQSATLVFINNGNGKWRIINTGATVS